MLHKAIQVRFYSTQNQKLQLAPTLGGAGWWWNYNLNKLIELYKKTGKKMAAPPSTHFYRISKNQIQVQG